MAQTFVIGGSHSDNAKFCRSCGTKLTEEHVSSEYDEQNGKIIRSTYRKVCPHCTRNVKDHEW